MRHTNVAMCVLIAITAGSSPDASHGQLERSSPARLDVTRDAWVSEVGAEADGNNGGAPRLKLKSIQEMSLVDIDPRPLLGRTIRSAMLHMKKAGDEPLARVTVSSVGAEWFEGTGSGYAVQPGGATFRHRRHPDLPWSIGGGDLCHVVLGNGGTTWGMADASPPDPEGWQHMPVDPLVVAARVAGLSHGFLLFDDTGSEWTRVGETFTSGSFPIGLSTVASRTERVRPISRSSWVRTIAGRRRPRAACGSSRRRRFCRRARLWSPGLRPGMMGQPARSASSVMLDGRALPRELIPLAAVPGERVEMHLRDLKLGAGTTVRSPVRAVDGAGNLGPAATAVVTVSSHVPTPLPEPRTPLAAESKRTLGALPQVAGIEVAILDELDKVQPAHRRDDPRPA